MPNPILDAARARLLAITAERAALDREERELRAMVAAAEGTSVQPVAPAPTLPLWPPTINPSPSPMWPPFVPAPSPLTPWIVAPHGGMCACPRCCPPWTLGGEGWTSIRAEMPSTIYIGDVNPGAGNTIASGLLRFDPNAAPSMLVDGWRECGISDVTGGPYYVKPGATWDCNPAGIVAPNGVRYTS